MVKGEMKKNMGSMSSFMPKVRHSQMRTCTHVYTHTRTLVYTKCGEIPKLVRVVALRLGFQDLSFPSSLSPFLFSVFLSF